MKFRFFLVLLLALTLMSCVNTEDDDDASPTVNKPWEKVEWETADNGAYADFTHQGLQPSCMNAPGTDPKFSFFYREGAANNLVVYFQGGGACWHKNNSITLPTCSQQLRSSENIENMNSIGAGEVSDTGGIFNFTESENPFKDWSFIYIPYCSGDLFWGAKDVTYDGDTVRHRGRVNTEVVIEWMKNKYPTTPDKIFVTGISAGSYGAIANFPHLKEAFSAAEFHVFADAGNGVLSDDFISTGLVNWGVDLPGSATLPSSSSFTGLDGLELADLTIATFYAIVANHYTATNFAQYTTAWDNNQTFFYNVMENIDDPTSWGDITSDTIWQDWHDGMLANLAATEASSDAGNYKYYIAPGDVHTISMSSKMYDESSDGVNLMDWIDAMLADGTAFENVKCVGDCGKPAKFQQAWQRIKWATADDGKYADFTHNGLAPSCTNAPGTDPEFSFMYREGTENKLMVYFQGGGACWHTNNTIAYPTCYQEVRVSKKTGVSGILDPAPSDNPFKDWSMVFIPYCSGDLFWGANDATYDTTSDSYIVRHRGNVNAQVVIEWMKNKYKTTVPEEIFVTGSSAGSYGAMFNFPYIKETFSDVPFHVFADAGAGVLNADFKNSGLANWDIQIPTSTTLASTSTFNDFDNLADVDLSIVNLFSTIANHYTGTKFGQYTTAWDEAQVFFYKVMKNISDPTVWTDKTSDSIWCDWNTAMLKNITDIDTSSDANNIKYYIAPGDVHTILLRSDVYDESSDGVALMDWIDAMLTDEAAFENVKCVGDCGKPATCPDC